MAMPSAVEENLNRDYNSKGCLTSLRLWRNRSCDGSYSTFIEVFVIAEVCCYSRFTGVVSLKKLHDGRISYIIGGIVSICH